MSKVYGISADRTIVVGLPVVAKRNPTQRDNSYNVGKKWINDADDGIFILTKKTAGNATWSSLNEREFVQTGSLTIPLGTGISIVRVDSILATDTILYGRSSVNTNTIALASIVIAVQLSTNQIGFSTRSYTTPSLVLTTDDSTINYAIIRN